MGSTFCNLTENLSTHLEYQSDAALASTTRIEPIWHRPLRK